MFLLGIPRAFVFVNIFGAQLDSKLEMRFHNIEPDAFNLSAIIGVSQFVPLGFILKISILPVYDIDGSVHSSLLLLKSTFKKISFPAFNTRSTALPPLCI